MLDIEVYEKLSPKAKLFYDSHKDYFDEMAREWGDFVDMGVVIEEATKQGRIEESSSTVRAN
ncbi:hypothetical protein IJ114_03535 [Candidatus Saccharibacteria bacterium]|nr:hypothetical protein [Candidatus Saccharibacteria bacterium]MBQ9029808.1 hypothetical protein [Candidatus Saccharibacteria bacterium]